MGGTGGVGGVVLSYLTIVPLTFGKPKGWHGSTNELHFHACVVEASKCKCVPVEFPVFPIFPTIVFKSTLSPTFTFTLPI